jgi:hypothetical protein
VKKLLAMCVVGALALPLTGCTSGPADTKPTNPAKSEPGKPIKSEPGKSEPGAPKTETAEGTFVSAEKDKITIAAGADKKEWSAAITADTKITRDGKAAKWDELKKEDKVKVTYTGKDKDAKATEITATPAAAPPVPTPVDATVTKAGDKATDITIKAGDKDYTLDDKTKITVDGKEGKPADVKKDMKGKATIADGKVTEFALPKP